MVDIHPIKLIAAACTMNTNRTEHDFCTDSSSRRTLHAYWGCPQHRLSLGLRLPSSVDGVTRGLGIHDLLSVRNTWFEVFLSKHVDVVCSIYRRRIVSIPKHSTATPIGTTHTHFPMLQSTHNTMQYNVC